MSAGLTEPLICVSGAAGQDGTEGTSNNPQLEEREGKASVRREEIGKEEREGS